MGAAVGGEGSAATLVRRAGWEARQARRACAKLRRMLPANFMTTATIMPPAALVKMASHTSHVKPCSIEPSSLRYL